MLTDFHSHILPEMDDGASSAAESVRLIKILMESGVQKIVLTPHFYRENENIESFLKRREISFEKLLSATSDIPGCPQFVLGAEVYFHASLACDKDLEKLRIEGTDYLLLELPFERFFDNFFSEYSSFINRCQMNIILAHIERYLSFGNKLSDIRHILNMGNAVCQINCSPLAQAGLFERKTYLDLIRNGYISVIGTDTHNTTSRPPMYQKAMSIIKSKCGEAAFERICENSDKILSNCHINKLK